MPPQVKSTSPPPRRRRALQERSSAHTNERSPTRSLRRAAEQEDADFYTATPFPTKPEQILLPIPGKGQQEYISDTGLSYSDAQGPSMSTWSSPAFSQPARSSLRAQSIGESWDVSSTVNTGQSPPQMWEDDPLSSNSSLPEIRSGSKEAAYASEGSSSDYSDEEMIVLPAATPTIKAVVSEPPTSPVSEPERAATRYSSPNFVALDNSSMTFHPPGSSHSGTDPRSNSLSSYGTVVKHGGVAPWIHTASSEQSSSRSPSFHSSPPLRPIASYQSLPRRASVSRPRSGTSSSRSFQSVSDIQAAIDNGVPIQYPRIRAASSSSRADTAMSSERDFTPGPVSGRWNPHLSTVSSVWSEDELPGGSSLAEKAEQSGPAPALPRDKTKSSVWLVQESSDEEGLDSLTKRAAQTELSNSLSSASKRSNSTRSMMGPGTTSSYIFQILPTWAKIYYRADAFGLNSALSMVDASRPSSARPGTGNSSVFNLMPPPLNIPRPRSPERPRSPQRPRSPERVRFAQRRIESDPRDPRAHWVPNPEVEEFDVVGSPRHRLRHSWSPHLYTDKRTIQHSASAWTCPSMDTTVEPTFGLRNIQVYAFSLGFIFPLAWMVASFLPLPLKPKMGPEMLESNDDLEMALEMQLMSMQQRRYDNARWWRNLNRWMISLGVVIIIIIVSTAPPPRLGRYLMKHRLPLLSLEVKVASELDAYSSHRASTQLHFHDSHSSSMLSRNSPYSCEIPIDFRPLASKSEDH